MWPIIAAIAVLAAKVALLLHYVIRRDRSVEIPAPTVHRGFGEQLGRPRTPEDLACWCETCRPITMDDCRMVLCPTCGNKRCPRANDHRHECSGSNEPGQAGSGNPRWPSEGGA